MTSPLYPTETEATALIFKTVGSKQGLRWCSGLDLDFLKSPRTLWTSRDLLTEAGAANRGVCARLGIAFKACGFSHRVVRSLFDVRSGKLQPQCTVWRTRP